MDGKQDLVERDFLETGWVAIDCSPWVTPALPFGNAFILPQRAYPLPVAEPIAALPCSDV